MHLLQILAFFPSTAIGSVVLPWGYPWHGGDAAGRLQRELAPILSPGSSITQQGPPRWSEYNPPKSRVVVNVKTETDVAATVAYCTSMNMPFLAQNGGGGWAEFNQDTDTIIINLAGLNSVTVSKDKRTATIGGGTSIEDTIAAGDAAGVLIHTGNCNCVGSIGAMLAGGYGNLMGLHGFGVDNVISMRVVTADGRLQTVKAGKNWDLFWALRGAGPNFGIVTSAVVKAYAEKQRVAWTGALVFTEDKLEQVVQAVGQLYLEPRMNVFLYFVSPDPKTNAPAIVVTPYLFQGSVAEGRAAFKSLYDVGPAHDTTAVIPYTQWNQGADGFCTRGGRKPSYTVGLDHLVPQTWRQVWDLYVDFQKKPGAQSSVVLCEIYSLQQARSIPASSSAFPHRNVNHFAVVIPWYNDTALDTEALDFGTAARDLWISSDALPGHPTYANFGHGDEDLQQVYAQSLPRLRQLKQRFDPNNRFNQWFPIR